MNELGWRRIRFDEVVRGSSVGPDDPDEFTRLKTQVDPPLMRHSNCIRAQRNMETVTLTAESASTAWKIWLEETDVFGFGSTGGGGWSAMGSA